MAGKGTGRPGKSRDGLRYVPVFSLPLNRLGLICHFVRNSPLARIGSFAANTDKRDDDSEFAHQTRTSVIRMTKELP